MQTKKPRRSEGSSPQDGTSDRATPEGPARIARLVVSGPPPESAASAQSLLVQCFEESWPPELRAKFTLTMGGFLRSDFSTPWSGATGSESGADELAALIAAARPTVSAVLSPRVLSAAARCTQYLTLGVDLGWPDGIHAELVATVDTASGAIVSWTGKSFPTASQSHRLIQVADLESHFLDAADERVLILGSHDLSVFHPRGRKSLGEGSLRWQRCQEIDALLARHRPTLVLQHAHTTDSPQLWQEEWKYLTKQVPSISCWASGIAYQGRDKGEPPRRPLDEVLAGTRAPREVVDVLLPAQRTRARAADLQDEKQPAR